MRTWKSRLVQTYRIASLPLRALHWLSMIRHGTVPILVLNYHRVADTDLNPWTLTREAFSQQLDWMQDRFEIVDLEECQRRIACGYNDKPTLALTFDDGYADNCDFAIPLLIERRIPATYFVTTYHTLYQQPFPRDVDRARPLPTNSLDSILAMDRAGIEMGGHSRTHPDLGSIDDPQQLVDEVIAASVEMETLLGRPIRYFAFPGGQPEQLNRDAVAMLKEAGFLGICSAYGGWNAIGSDPFHLLRLPGEQGFEFLRNWLTYDPQLARIEKVDVHGGRCSRELVQQTITTARARVWPQPPAIDFDTRLDGGSDRAVDRDPPSIRTSPADHSTSPPETSSHWRQ